MNPARYWRLSILGALLCVVPVVITVQLLRLQIDPTQYLPFEKQFPEYQKIVRTIVPVRGEIYDRYGNLFAGNKTVYEVGVELYQVRDPETIARVLSSILDLDYFYVYSLASKEPSEEAVYNVIKDYVSQAQVDQIEQTRALFDELAKNSPSTKTPSLRGITYFSHLARHYPENALGSNLIGFVNKEGKAFFGLEEKYNTLLSGKPRKVLISLNPNQVTELPEVPPGASLVLSVDRSIQASMEEILDRSIDFHGAESGTIVVMDPRNGEVLALATTPRIDLNNYEENLDAFSGNIPFNRGVSQAYEPGSVFKILTVAAGLDSGTVQPASSYVDVGVFELGGIQIYNWNYGAWGPQDILGCLQHSLNVCMAWIASQMGTETFYGYMQEFGIGQATGVDLAGEQGGRLKLPGDGDWYEADLGTNSFGQGVAVTPLQLAAAATAIANEGKLMSPHVVRSLVNKGYQYDIDPRVVAEPIRGETALTLSNMLADALEIEASDALVTGYRVAGKTGTGEIPTPFGYTSNQTNASFVGWGPVDDPRFLVYVWLEKPSSSIWGSEVAAPVFRDVVEHLVVLMNLAPDEIRMQLRGQE